MDFKYTEYTFLSKIDQGVHGLQPPFWKATLSRSLVALTLQGELTGQCSACGDNLRILFLSQGKVMGYPRLHIGRPDVLQLNFLQVSRNAQLSCLWKMKRRDTRGDTGGLVDVLLSATPEIDVKRTSRPRCALLLRFVLAHTVMPCASDSRPPHPLCAGLHRSPTCAS